MADTTLNMRPTLSGNDAGYLVLTDSKDFRHLGLIHFFGVPETADFDNVRLRQLATAMIDTSWSLYRSLRCLVELALDTATLVCHIPHILFLCSKKEMVWIDAGPNVALVANLKPIRDGAVSQFIRNPVGRMGLVVNKKLAVAAPITAGRPNPTVSRFIDFRPETLHDRADLIPADFRAKSLGFHTLNYSKGRP